MTSRTLAAAYGLAMLLATASAVVNGPQTGPTSLSPIAEPPNQDQTLPTDPKLAIGGNMVKPFLDGVDWKKVGYPARKALVGAEGASLIDGTSEINEQKNAGKWIPQQRPYPADDPVVPGIPKGGKMSAKDVEGSVGMITNLQKVIDAGAKMDADFAATKEEVRNRKMQKLIASIKSDPTKSSDLNSGALLHHLAILKGNVGNCQKETAQCKEYGVRELGESDEVSKVVRSIDGPTTTATEDDAKESGDTNDFLANAKATKSTEGPKMSATEDYTAAQTGGPWDRLDGEPGMKLPHDRMPASHLASMVGVTGHYIRLADEMAKKDGQRDKALVEDAQQKLVSAITDQEAADNALADLEKPETTDSVLAEMRTAGQDLNACMEKYVVACKKQFNMASSLKWEDIDPAKQLPNPRDSPEYKIDTSVNPKMGPGGDKPIVKSDPPPDRP